jgi:hypothetical protein
MRISQGRRGSAPRTGGTRRRRHGHRRRIRRE